MTPDYTRAARATLRLLIETRTAKAFASVERDLPQHHARSVKALAEIAGEYGYVLTPMPEQQHVKEGGE